MKLCFIVGTRPEIIKMAPIIKECQRRKINFFIVHTGQHYSYNLDKVFFEELNLPEPKYNLNVGSGTQAVQTAKALVGIEKILFREKPDVVLVEGDTNTVLAGALAAAKLHIKVGHVEAGLRSYFKFMPEEINRILTDHCSDFLFAPTKKESLILNSEGIKKNVFVTGNTIVDSVLQNIKIAEEKSNIMRELGLTPKKYFLITAHRMENVDDKNRLKNMLLSFRLLYKKFKLRMLYPIHPRTLKMIKKFKFKIPRGVEILKPLSYLDFLTLEKNALLILTDSGGVQEEACILRVPCVTLRDNTERPETVEVGANTIAGVRPKSVVKAVGKMVGKKPNWRNPFGDGKSAFKIINIIEKNLSF